ncbi:glycosyltransferase family 2 protein [Weissella cibaria]
MPLISVIMPVYNVQDYVATAIESVLNQIDDLELIIVNDGSTDNSQKICEKYLFDNRVQIHTIKNSGLSVARNTGLALATGEFVYFMDSDDVLRNGFFKLIHSILLNQRCDGISFSYEETNDEDIAEALLRPVTSITRNIKRNKIEILTDLMHECVEIMAWTYIVRRSILIKEDVRYTPGVLFEDNNSAPKIFAAGNSFFLVSMDIPPLFIQAATRIDHGKNET